MAAMATLDTARSFCTKMENNMATRKHFSGFIAIFTEPAELISAFGKLGIMNILIHLG
jgi:hypothetical protein